MTDGGGSNQKIQRSEPAKTRIYYIRPEKPPQQCAMKETRQSIYQSVMEHVGEKDTSFIQNISDSCPSQTRPIRDSIKEVASLVTMRMRGS